MAFKIPNTCPNCGEKFYGSPCPRCSKGEGKKETMKLHQLNYASLAALGKQAIHGQRADNIRLSSQTTGNKEWYGTNSFEEFCQLFKTGWPTGLNTINKIVKDHQDVFTSYFPQQDYTKEQVPDVEGASVDVAKAVTGEPEDMIRWQESHKITPGHRFQRIITNSAASCFVSPETIFIRGGLIATLVNALEMYGYRVELLSRTTINSIDMHTRDGTTMVIDTLIKAFDESPDLDKIALVTAHPGFLRRFIFSIMEQQSPEIRKVLDVGGYYGYPCEWKEGVLETDLYFPRPGNNEPFEVQFEWFKKVISQHFGEIQITE